MELRYLKTLKVITESGSFAKAAERLNYTRSTVTFQVQQMEREFGIPLFEKIGKNMCLSREGKAILPLVDTILGSYDRILAFGNSEASVLNIAVPESLLTFRFQPIIRAFREKMPLADLQIQTRSCYDMNQILLAGDADIAIHYNVQREDPNIYSEAISECPLVFFGSPQMTEQERDFRTTDQKKNFGFIDIEINGLYRKSLNRLLKEKNITLSNDMVLGSIAAIVQCIRMGLGVSVLPEFAVQKEIRDGGVIRLDGELDPPAVSVMLSYHSHKRLTPAMEYFLDLCRQML